MSQQILTPNTTKLLVQAAREAGYIEREQDFPMVIEVPKGFMFVARDNNDGSWLVSRWWHNGDWNYTPYHECNLFSDAKDKLIEIVQRELNSLY